MKSFLKALENVGTWILKGVEIAAPVIGAVDPPLAPILMEVAQVVAILEAKGQTVDANSLQAIVQAVATHSAVKNPGLSSVSSS